MDVTRQRGLGDFGNRILFAPFEMTAESLLPTATMFGLPNSATILWGAFEDEDGVSYTVARELPCYLSNGCWVMNNASGKGMKLLPQSAAQWRGGLDIQHAGNRVEWQSTDIYSGAAPSFRLIFDDSRLEWDEQGLVGMTARRVTTGYQLYEPTHGQGATNHIFEASGVIAGKKVFGWLGLNVCFQKPGINYRISPMTRGGQMVMWFDVGNIYEDGSWEQGPIITGLDGFSYAWIINDKGQVTYSSDVEVDIDVDADMFATEARFRYFDARTGEPMHWVWRPRPGANMVDLPGLAPHLKYKRSAEGSCVRLGETRVLRHTSAWPEFQVDERLQAYAKEKQNNAGAVYL